MHSQIHITYRQMIQLIAMCFVSLIGIFVIFNSGATADNRSGYSFTYSGLSSPVIDYQSYITPDSNLIKDIADRISSIEEAYDIANRWLYVSEQVLHGVDDRWEMPEQFISASPGNPNNPVPGSVAGDCEEQANTLVSLIRAIGVPPEDVRVALGLVTVDTINRGHVWVEIYRDGRWIALDPSQGSTWDVNTSTLITREGLDFDYYVLHPYPVNIVTAYYNDIYYMETKGLRDDDIPSTWNMYDRRYPIALNIN